MIVLSNKLLAPYVRFLNAADMMPLDFAVINKTAAAATDYGKITKYIRCDRGSVRFGIRNDSGKEFCAVLSLNLQIGDVYTICAIKNDTGYALVPVCENIEKENLDLGHLRVCNLYRNCREISAYADETCFVGGIGTNNTSRYVELIPNKYKLSIKASDSGEEVINCGMQSVKSGRYNTLFVLTPKNTAGEALGIFTIDAPSYDSMYL